MNREEFLANARFHGERKRRYQQAARCPWLAIEPGPPPPE
jgi:hypothetical protein